MKDCNMVFNEALFSLENTRSFRDSFEHAQPYKNIVIDHFLDNDFAESIYHSFPPLESMGKHYSGFNERKAEDTRFERLESQFEILHKAVASPEFTKWLEGITAISPLMTIEDRLGYGLHQGGDKSFLDIHIDYNIHPKKKLLRKLNLILFFNAKWEENWGGALELWDDKATHCIKKIAPLFNRAVLFECSEISFHGYNQITVPDGITRKSYYQYYFTPPNAPVRFHDTVFKAKPGDGKIKKMITPAKEYIKNSSKKLLLKLGWDKFLD